MLGGRLHSEVGFKRGGMARVRYHRLLGLGELELKGEHRANGDWSSSARFEHPVSSNNPHMGSFVLHAKADRQDRLGRVSYSRKFGRGTFSINAQQSHQTGFTAGLSFSIPLSGKVRSIKRAFEKADRLFN